MKQHILLVEDDENFGSVLKAYLEVNGYQVARVTDGGLAFNRFEKEYFDLVLLDVMLPHEGGFSIAEKIRATEKGTPFIFITAKSLHEDIIKGYKTGADDYIIKPFDSEVLLMKIKAVINRSDHTGQRNATSVFNFGDFQFNFRTRQLSHSQDKKPVTLSPKEAALLRLLLEYRGEVMLKNRALNQIWGEVSYFTTRSMDVYITKLRKHLRADPRMKIITLHGAGYRLVKENATF